MVKDYNTIPPKVFAPRVQGTNKDYIVFFWGVVIIVTPNVALDLSWGSAGVRGLSRNMRHGMQMCWFLKWEDSPTLRLL